MEQRIYVEGNYILDYQELSESIRIAPEIRESFETHKYYGYIQSGAPSRVWCSACRKGAVDPIMVYRILHADYANKFAQPTGFMCQHCGHINENVVELPPWLDHTTRIVSTVEAADASKMALTLEYDEINCLNESITVSTRRRQFVWFQDGKAIVKAVANGMSIRRRIDRMISIEESIPRWEFNDRKVAKAIERLIHKAYNSFGRFTNQESIWELVMANKYRGITKRDARICVRALSSRIGQIKAEELVASATRSNFVTVGKTLGLPTGIARLVGAEQSPMRVIRAAEMYRLLSKEISTERIALLCERHEVGEYLYDRYSNSIPLIAEFILLLKSMGQFYSKASQKGGSLAIAKIVKHIVSSSFDKESFTLLLRNLWRINERCPEALKTLNFTDMVVVMSAAKVLLNDLIANHEGYIYPLWLTKAQGHFNLVRNEAELQLVAAKLKNCLAGYNQQIKDGSSAILILGDIEAPTGALAIRLQGDRGHITEARGVANNRLSPSQIRSIVEWGQANGVSTEGEWFQ